MDCQRHVFRHLAALARFTQRLRNLITAPLQHFPMQRDLVHAATGNNQTPQEYFEHYWETLEKLLIRDAMNG